MITSLPLRPPFAQSAPEESRALQVGRGLSLLCGIDTRVDLIEGLALANDGTLLERAPQDHARYLRPNVRHLEGGDPTGQLLLERRAALLDHNIADVRGTPLAAAPPRTSRVLLTAPAPGEQQQCRRDSEGRAFLESRKNHSCGQFRLCSGIASPRARDAGKVNRARRRG